MSSSKPPPPPMPLLSVLLLFMAAVRPIAARARAEPLIPAVTEPVLITTIPEFLHVCHRSDPNLDECVRKSVESLRPRLAEGIPELGLPACEPLRVPALSLEQGRGAVAVRSEYSDVRLWGVPQFVLRSVRLDVNRCRARLRVRFPRLRLRCRYHIVGQILMLPIRGRGDAYGNYTDVEATVGLHGAEETAGGRTFLRVRSLTVDLMIGHAEVHLDDLFDGDPELGEAMNLFLNDNWRNVAAEMRPALERAVADLCMELAQSVFSRFPLDQLLPP